MWIYRSGGKKRWRWPALIAKVAVQSMHFSLFLSTGSQSKSCEMASLLHHGLCHCYGVGSAPSPNASVHPSSFRPGFFCVGQPGVVVLGLRHSFFNVQLSSVLQLLPVSLPCTAELRLEHGRHTLGRKRLGHPEFRNVRFLRPSGISCKMQLAMLCFEWQTPAFCFRPRSVWRTGRRRWTTTWQFK